MPICPAVVNVPGIAAGHPDGRVALAVGLGEDVVGRRHGEVLALEHVVTLLPHAWDLADDLVPLGLGRVLVEDVEGGHLVAARTAAGPPLEPVVGEVVHHGGPLGVADGVLLAGRQTVDGRTDVDPLGPGGHVAHDRLGSRHVRVLGQGVVLAEPGVLPVVEVGRDGDLELALDHQVLGIGVTGRRPREIPVDEDSELHFWGSSQTARMCPNGNSGRQKCNVFQICAWVVRGPP